MSLLGSLYTSMITGIDPIVDNWFLMKTPFPTLITVTVYLYFVLKSGPKLMKRRKPFKLKWILIFYNGFQVIFSAWLFWMALTKGKMAKLVFTFGCELSSNKDRSFFIPLWETTYWFHWAKMIDLLDTVFFVLRKKQNQVTFLHVYHHSIMALYSYFFLKYMFGEQGLMMGCLNAFIHVMMYSYYLIAALGPAYQKYIWWKKYMTVLQLGQFCILIVFVVAGLTVVNCNQPKIMLTTIGFMLISFLYLFAKFYKNSYRKQRSRN